MQKKIKNSLSAKVFLWVFTALTICSVLIYGILMAVVPERYQFVNDGQLENNTNALFSELENISYEDAIQKIYNFCIENNAVATLIGGNESQSFGDIEGNRDDTETTTYTIDLVFRESDVAYTLAVSSISKAASQIALLFIKLLPAILAVILLISALSAWICSRLIVTPIAKISQISKRMTALDMTWRCDVGSADEIGVLATSLNTMAGRLQITMKKLEDANRSLTDDVEKFKELEIQRRNFFAAVSHELKTPLTILKGQIENMMMGYGDYKNHDKYLPQALKAADNIEFLIKEIISITKMESVNLDDTLETASLSELVSRQVKELLPIADEKQIIIHQDLSEDVSVSVNIHLFRKALSNIIGNAVRHSPSAAAVSIVLQTNRTSHTLVVENTGVFIAEEDLSHMFTPFYRTDKSRSKATGGSGLGLYIVKTVLDLHGMGYHIENTERGVAFYLELND